MWHMPVGGEIEARPPRVAIWEMKKVFSFANVVVDIRGIPQILILILTVIFVVF